MHAWVGLEGGFEAVRVTEWGEPQAVFGSYLQRYAYPDYYKMHVERNHRELVDWTRGETCDGNLSRRDASERRPSATSHRGRTAWRAACSCAASSCMWPKARAVSAPTTWRASANKDVSEKILTAPFSPLGQDMHVASKNATCMALPTNQPIDPTRNTEAMRKANEEQPFHPIYNYAVITDSEEGLILVNINPLATAIRGTTSSSAR